MDSHTITLLNKDYTITETETKWLVKCLEPKLEVSFEVLKSDFPTIDKLREHFKEVFQ